MLHYKVYEAKQPSNTVCILLHGFMSDSSIFDQHIATLTKSVKVVTVDLPGHGKDESSLEEQWHFQWIAEQLYQVIREVKEACVVLHGYSMGARVALYYGCYYPELLNGLILESGSPGIDDGLQRAERSQVDEARAKVLELAPFETFVKDWERLPLFQSQRFLDEAEQQRIRQMRLRQSPEKLAKALREYGTGVMPNLWGTLENLRMPVQLIVGEWDEKFVSIAQNMLPALQHGKLDVVPQVGHTVHVEDVAKFDTITLDFIKGLNEEDNDGKTMGNIKRI
ncbi:2-succinyl-6-hydroxy-2,4-cyclohexadiene-1-carboxylate synthase [Staphylococcus ratti]|uniref:Putative 2-succinyl-6-hydroxy-2,4-cyclohexadiene-1-carboxylate synthase n=1 Tax=Staphylococcus ratti TaxID=2892440 RepID=A0ABY3PB35_9STAP|nr:2-succinyl-6-hydroxy-2,4-cyclohexadiene-1-carboxylate synthase [Staphylococcus ratti]UEX89517.1 2-succinyl-6-hydroxy-2,4-cyclohexadiene-1-carboxylate synthase [Staphylococcus ratti]